MPKLGWAGIVFNVVVLLILSAVLFYVIAPLTIPYGVAGGGGFALVWVATLFGSMHLCNRVWDRLFPNWWK